MQAARSCRQNIVEGSADGVTSTEMKLKLLNVARNSIKELKEDYEDYLTSRHLERWNTKHLRYDGMLKFCRKHNRLEDYQSFFDKILIELFDLRSNFLTTKQTIINFSLHSLLQDFEVSQKLRIFAA